MPTVITGPGFQTKRITASSESENHQDLDEPEFYASFWKNARVFKVTWHSKRPTFDGKISLASLLCPTRPNPSF